MDKDEMIDAQNKMIDILLGVIERVNENSALDEEYVTLALAGGSSDRIHEIREARQQNAEAISRLLDQLEM